MLGFFILASILLAVFLYSSNSDLVNAKNSLQKQELLSQQLDKTGLQLINEVETLQKVVNEQKEDIKSLEIDLAKRNKEVLELNGKQRTSYEEQRAKWRNYAAGIINELVKDLEHTASKCWDSDRDDFEDCLEDEFEDDSDQEITQILNLA